jgi:hypothetical protein
MAQAIADKTSSLLGYLNNECGAVRTDYRLLVPSEACIQLLIGCEKATHIFVKLDKTAGMLVRGPESGKRNRSGLRFKEFLHLPFSGARWPLPLHIPLLAAVGAYSDICLLGVSVENTIVSKCPRPATTPHQ